MPRKSRPAVCAKRSRNPNPYPSTYELVAAMAKPRASSIGIRSPTGTVSDAKFHEAIMEGVDDTPLRTLSAKQAMVKLGLSREEAEELFSVKLPPDIS